MSRGTYDFELLRIVSCGCGGKMDALLFGVTFNNRKPVLKLFESDLVLSEIASQMRDLRICAAVLIVCAVSTIWRRLQ